MLKTGDIIHSRYRIVTPLGSGGFGTVYRAWDLSLSRAVALKENMTGDDDARRQFQREAQVLAGLSHPNLPRVTDHFFLTGQGQYLVMDFIDGEDLQALLNRRGVLPVDEVLPWLQQVADALDYLHARQIFHRDIKPANIRITPDGRAFLVDFGLVKLAATGDGHTTRGARAVTPGFSPPEQYGSGHTDARSDVYALAATLYALLTGREPVESVMRSGQDTLPPPDTLNPAVPAAVSSAIMHGLALAPAGRPAAAGDFIRHVQQAQHGGSISRTQVLPPQPVTRRSPVLLYSGIGATALLIVLAALLMNADLRTGIFSAIGLLPTETPTPTLTPSPTDTLAPTATATPTLTPSPVPPVDNDPDGDGLSNDEERALGTDAQSPDTDGDGLSDYEEARIYATNPTARDSDDDGLTDYEEAPDGCPSPLTWDSDSDGMADGIDDAACDGPVTAEPPTPTPTPTTAPPPPSGDRGRIVFVSDRDGGDALYVMEGTNHASARRISQPPDNGYDWWPTWCGSDTLVFERFDADGNATGNWQELLLLEGVSRAQPDIYLLTEAGVRPADSIQNGSPSCTRDGTQLAFSSRPRGAAGNEWYLTTMDLGTLETQRIGSGYALAGSASWTADARMLYFMRLPPGNREFIMLRLALDTPDTVVNLSADVGGSAKYPALSPDGRQIAFACYQTAAGVWGLCLKNSDGSGLRVIDASVVINERSADGSQRRHAAVPTWSPDGRYIAYAGIAVGDWDIFTYDTVTGEIVNITGDSPADEFHPAWEP